MRIVLNRLGLSNFCQDVVDEGLHLIEGVHDVEAMLSQVLDDGHQVELILEVLLLFFLLLNYLLLYHLLL